MSHKELVVTAAILGTEQQAVPDLDASGSLAHSFAQLKDVSAKLGRERALLHISAIVCLYEKSGQRLAKFNEELPLPAFEDQRPLVSANAAGHFRAILDDKQDLLPEWLQIVSQQNKRVPDDCLVGLLQIGSKNVSLRELVAGSVGARAQWLSQFNPVWKFVRRGDQSLDTDIAKLRNIFDFGAIEERIWALKGVRCLDPSIGLELMRAAWKTDRAEDRARFLVACEIGLSMNDEPFLEAEALDDKRKEVRQAARDLLFKLPDSRLSMRARQRAFACLSLDNQNSGGFLNNTPVAQIKKKAQLAVDVPEACDKSMQRDGIVSKPADSRMGEKAWWLCQVLEQVDPDKLLKHLNLTGEQYLEAIRGSSWQAALSKGFNGAVVRFRHRELAKLLLQQDQVDNSENLFALLESSEQEKVLAWLLEMRGFLLICPVQSQYDSEALNLLMSMKHLWSIDFSKIMLKTLRTHISQKNNFIFMDYILRHVANHMDTELWAGVQESWSTVAKIDPTLERMMSILSFRKEMRDALIKDL